jgi:hypothetical protein
MLPPTSQQIIMCLIIVVVVFYAGASALALRFLPPWLAIPLVSIVGLALLYLWWKIRRFFKKLKATFADFIPQENIRKLAAGETFNGHGFTFTFPVACEVSQTHFHEVEALLLKPKFDFEGAPKDTMLVVSTFSPEELKPEINETIEKIFAQVEGKGSEPAPVTVGPLAGERRTFATSKDGKDVRGEVVYLGDKNGSIVWVAIAMGSEAFETLGAKYRELALLIKRVESPAPPNPS